MSLTLPEAARQAGVRVGTLQNWARRGWLPVSALGTVTYPDVLAASTKSVELYGVPEPTSNRARGRPQRGRGQYRPRPSP